MAVGEQERHHFLTGSSIGLERKLMAIIEVQTTLLEDPELDEMVRRIVDAYHPLCIYLFGSKAHGDAGRTAITIYSF